MVLRKEGAINTGIEATAAFHDIAVMWHGHYLKY